MLKIDTASPCNAMTSNDDGQVTSSHVPVDSAFDKADMRTILRHVIAAVNETRNKIVCITMSRSYLQVYIPFILV